MSKKQEEPRPELSETERNEGFIGRRMRAFGERSREPGDGATWATVLGALMWTLLIICFSIADLPLFALASFVLTFVWVTVMGQFGKVNVASILWGSATTDNVEKPPVDVVVFQSTMLVALLSLVSIIVDAIRGWNFGWYGLVLIVTVAIYLLVYMRTWLQADR